MSGDSRGVGPALLVAEVVVAVALTGLAVTAAVRLALAAGPLWRDEVSTVNLARVPSYGELFALLDRDSAPALYVTVVRVWTSLGRDSGDASLRLLGLLVTLATLAVVWLSARRLAGVPLLALAFFGAHGFVLDTLGAVRPYGLGALWVVLSFASAWALVSSPGLRTFIPAVAAFVLSVQTLYTNAVMVLALCAAAAIVSAARREWRTIAFFIAAGAAAAASMLPYAGVVSRSMAWRPLNYVSFGASDVLLRWGSTFAGGDVRLAGLWVVVTILGLGATATMLASRTPFASRQRLAYAALAAIGATVLHLAFIALSRRLPSYWHFAALMGLVALALDTTFVERRWLRWARLGLVMLALPALMPLALEQAGTRRTNVDLIAAHLAVNARGGDLIVVNPWTAGLTLTRYYRGAAPVMTLPPINDLRVHRYDLLKERMASPSPLTELHNVIADTLRAGGRVWLVGDLILPPPGEPPTVLPAAPGAPTGWAEDPYYRSWMMQTGDLLRRRALRWRLIDLSETQPVNGLERLRFGVVEGWRGD